MADNPVYWRHFKGLSFHLCRWSNIVPYTVFGTLEWSQRAIQLRDLRISVSWSSLSQWRFCISVRMLLSNNCIFWGETAMTHIYSNTKKILMWKICEIQGKISGRYLPQWYRETYPGSKPGSAMEIIARSLQRTSHILYSRFYIFCLKCTVYSNPAQMARKTVASFTYVKLLYKDTCYLWHLLWGLGWRHTRRIP